MDAFQQALAGLMPDSGAPAPDVTIFICISCTVEGARNEQPGRALFDAVSSAIDAKPGCGAAVKPVDCLAVCKRPCTVALAGDGKWTYVVGDLSPDTHAEDVVNAALSYGATANGIIPWKQRPQSFRKGVISRVPPLGFRPEDQGL
jgi:predicted metal-binding protein